MNGSKLGSGSYGEVWERDGYAIKRFNRMNAFIIECTACVAMKGRHSVVQYVDFDIENAEITYPLYSMNLEQWYWRRNSDGSKRTIDQILHCLHQINIGLINIHEATYVHNDLKPANILIRMDDDNISEVVIADLGMMQNMVFSKSIYCTEAYKEQNPPSSYHHDIFSLGIIFIRLLCDIRMNKQISHDYDKLQKIINNFERNYKNEALVNCIRRMISRDVECRPTAREILQEVWQEEYYPPMRINRKYRITDRQNTYLIINEECDMLMGKYYLPIADRFKAATIYYCTSRQITHNLIPKYCEASLYIAASMFNTRKKDDKHRQYPTYISQKNQYGKAIVREGKIVVIDKVISNRMTDEVRDILSCRTYVHILLVL